MPRLRRKPARDSEATQQQRLRDSERAVAERERRSAEETVRLARLTAYVRALQPPRAEDDG